MASTTSPFLLILVATAILLVVGIVLILLARSEQHEHPKCGRCGYDLSHLAGQAERCPECGSSFMEAGIVPAGRRSRRPFVIGGSVIIVLTLIGLLGSILVLRASVAATQRARQQAITAQQQANQTLQSHIAVFTAEAIQAEARQPEASETPADEQANDEESPETSD